MDFLDIKQNKNTGANLASRSYEGIFFKRKEIYELFATDRKIEYKNEIIATINNVKYINDAYSTNTNMTWFSMEQIPSRIVWIISDDNGIENYYDLKMVVQSKVSTIICFGKKLDKLYEAFNNTDQSIFFANNIDEAVVLASCFAKDNDAVLYSPANGIVSDVAERGLKFHNAVNKL
ncbi:MAG: hypothetical protein LBM25_00840 [Bacteroidales bacterium]|jgi:UDP-N-acetylmuramoylalanine-D-glutamate ligase|nr:hypothetical protein [Bacteroidales bacterium]